MSADEPLSDSEPLTALVASVAAEIQLTPDEEELLDALRHGAAGHFYKRRPVHLCGDDRDDDDEGPPNYAT